MAEAKECKIVSKTEVHSLKWLKLFNISWSDPNGKQRVWESVERTTRKGEVDAVSILGIIKKKGEGDRIILVKQFRPPLGKYTIEMPAGLVDGNESPETAALRELHEETGYIVAKAKSVSAISYNDVGITNTCSQMVHVEIDGDLPENQNPQPQVDDGEFIDVLTAPLDTLYEALVGKSLQYSPSDGSLTLRSSDYTNKGFGVAAKLMTYAYGLYFARTYK